MRNIDKFDEIVGLVFARLYEKFPVPLDITAGELVNNMKSLDDSDDEYTDVFTGVTEIIPSTIIWLHDEGYIRLEDTTTFSEHSWRRVTLTGKALSALKSTPTSLESQTTVGEKIATAARDGGREVLLASVNQLLSVGSRMWIES